MKPTLLLRGFRNSILAALVLLACSSQGFSQSFFHKNTEYSNSLVNAEDIVVPSGGVNNIREAVNNTLWTAMDPAASGNSVGHLMVKERKAFVRLFIDHNDPMIHPSYTYRVVLQVTGYPEAGNNTNTVVSTDTLTVSYNPDSVNAYQDIHMKTYYDFYKIKVNILEVYDYTCLYAAPGSTNPPPCSQPPASGFIGSNTLGAMVKNWALEIGVTDQKFDKDLKNGGSWVSAYGSTAALTASHTAPAAGDNFLTVKWYLVSGLRPSPALYELEWVYVDDYKVTFSSDALYFNYPVPGSTSANNLPYNFSENATRIITDKEEYKIPIVYKRGYLVYRVRLLRPEQSQYQYTVYSPWTVQADKGLVGNIPSASYFITGSDVHLGDQYNWNYQASFAEEGKSKHVVSYFDGLLKNRQSVTKFSTLPDQQLVSEQYYNYEGQIGLTTLPIPVNQKALSLVSNFATPAGAPSAGYTPGMIDGLTFSAVPALGSSSPAAGYYSSANSWYQSGTPLWKYLKSLPDAEGYPFIQTRYAPEDGRVTLQGGAGKELQIGQGHETRNYYLAPEPREIDKYFGLNAGRSPFYEKTIVRDPNKQLSFSIRNNKDQVVMSGLMGYPSGYSPLLLPDGVTLPPTTASSFPKNNLMDGNLPLWQGTTRVFNKSFFNETGNNLFSHSLNLPSFSPCSGYYLGVPLTYTIKAFDELGTPQTLQSTTVGTLYGSNTSAPISVANNNMSASLGIGKTIVDYRVSYDPGQLTTAINQLLTPVYPDIIPPNFVDPYPTCLKNLGNFIEEALDNINVDCEDPGASDQQNECVNYDALLQSELYPMGKYGKYIELNDLIQGANGSILAITGWDNNYNTYTSPAGGNDLYTLPPYNTSGPMPKPLYRYQFFLNAHPSPNMMPGNTPYTIAQLRDMPVEQFIAIFNDDIAALLMPLHPEYCKRQKIYCDESNYSEQLDGLNSYAVAASQQMQTLHDLYQADPGWSWFGSSRLKYLRHKNSSGNWVDTRIDIMAFIKAFCPEDGDCNTAVAAWSESFISSTVASYPADLQDKYFQELVQYYLTNRETRIAKFPVDGYAGSCTSNTYAIGSVTAPEVIRFLYNSGEELPSGIMTAAEQALVNGLTVGAGGQSTITGTVLAPLNGYDEYATEITERLSNCVYQSNGALLNKANLKTALLNSMNAASTNSEWKGGITPAVLKTILQGQGIRLDDLCNPYLVDYLQNPTYIRPPQICFEGTFYSSMSTFFNRPEIWQKTRDAYLSPGALQTGSTSCSHSSTGLFEKRLADRVDGGTGAVSVNFTVRYNSTDKSFRVYFYAGSQTYGRSVQVHYKDNDNAFTNVKINGNNGYQDINNNSYLITFMCGDDSAGNGMNLRGGYQNDYLADPFTGSIKGLSPPEPQDQSTCISPLEMKNTFSYFRADVMDATTGYAIKGHGHPFFERALRSYLNYHFKRSHTSQEYLDFMQGCNLSNDFRIPTYYAYLEAVSTTGSGVTANVAATNLVVNYLKNFNGGECKDFLYHYFYRKDAAGNINDVQLYIDFSSLPEKKLRQIIGGIATAVTGQPGITAPVLHYNKLHQEVTGVNAGFADLFVHYIPGAQTFYPPPAGQSSSPGGTIIAPSNMNWYPRGCTINPCDMQGNQVTPVSVNMTEDLVTVINSSGTELPFRRFHYDLVNANATSAQVADITYRYLTLVLPDPSRGFSSFSAYTTHLNSDNINNTKKSYLTYVYSRSYVQTQPGMLDNTRKDQLISELQVPALKSNINGVSPYTVNYNNYPFISYFNADKSGLSGDLFVQFMGNAPGLTYIGNALAQVPGGSPFSFTSIGAGTIPVGSEQMTQKLVSSNTFWYSLKNTAANTSKNFWITMPASIPQGQYPQYQIVSMDMLPTGEEMYRFVLRIQKPGGVVLQAYGTADFAIASNMTVYEHVMLCPHPTQPVQYISCVEQQILLARENAVDRYKQYIDSVRTSWTARFAEHLRTRIEDKLELQSPQAKYMITLYGYDRAGNLIYTVPPEGVRDIADNKLHLADAFRANRSDFAAPGQYPAGPLYAELGNITPAHEKVTSYTYNAQNQPVTQKTPDAGTTDFHYDAAGRLVFSQNAEQKLKNRYSYTLYDRQGRPIETGQVYNNPQITARVNDLRDRIYSFSFDDLMNLASVAMREEVVHTFYDDELLNLSVPPGMARQENLRSRVATVASYKLLTTNKIAGADNFDLALHYSYDLSGNVKTLIYDMPQLLEVKQRYKRIDYDFDLYSGKVTLVSYNRGFADQYYQQYEYDADNRITEVRTSKDGMLWDKDASYKYYPHGPLARVNLGDLQVQGIDFAYTLQGWLKTLNGDTPKPQNDLGGDATANSAYQNDLHRSALYYFKGDYKPIDGTDFSGTAGTSMQKIPDLDQAGNPVSLYNGNIAASVNMPGYFPALYSNYTYDQLNRLKKAEYKVPDYNATTAADVLKQFSAAPFNGQALQNVGQTGTATTANDLYKSEYSYDKDGNITALKRFGLLSDVNGKYNYASGKVYLMDNLGYFYENSGTAFRNNRLINFTDASDHSNVTPAFDNDLKLYTNSTLGLYRMTYDANGNMVKDLSNNLDKITWNLMGKTSGVDMANGDKMSFRYDPLGNRFTKTFVPGGTNTRRSEYYIRDASGNMLAVYQHLQKYRYEEKWPDIMTGLIPRSTFGPDVIDGLGSVGVLPAGGLSERMLNDYPSQAVTMITGRTLGKYLEHGPVIRGQVLAATTNVISDMMTADPEVVLGAFETKRFWPDLFVPMMHNLGNVTWTKNMIGKLAAPTDGGTMDRLLMAFTGTHYTTRDKFLTDMYSAMTKIDVTVFTNHLSKQLTGPSVVYASRTLAADEVYRSFRPAKNYPPGTAGDFIKNTVLPQDGNVQKMTWYYEDYRHETISNYRTAIGDVNLVSAMYDMGPAGFVDEIKNLSGAGTFLGTVIDASEQVTLTTFIANLLRLHPLDPQLSSLQLNEVIDYNKFFLAEHHVYGSSRLGIKKYWPNQYVYEWDATKTAAENETLLANSEFNYLRPWYSKLYNALAENGHNVPFGHVYKGGMYSERVLGQKQYELSNHLGNVMAVITDKVSEKKANPGSSLPTLAQKNAALYAAYDYYPFGMLMPERYQEDATSQCIPVTRTRYVKKLVEKYTNYFVSPTDASALTAMTAGTTLTPSFGSPGRPGNVSVYNTNGLEAVAQMALGGTSGLSAGKQLRVSTRIDNVQAVRLDVELIQLINGEQQSLGVRTLTSSEDVVFEATAVSSEGLRILYRSERLAPGPFKISVTQFYVVDEVQENYVVQLCNDDEAFGKDYRFGFNGQQKDNEVKGTGNSLDIDFRGYDSRLARFTSLDPLSANMPWNSPYDFAVNSPILYIDENGLGPKDKSKRLIFYSTGNKEKSNTETFFSYSLMLKRDYTLTNEYPESRPSVTAVNSGADVVRYINMQKPGTIQTLDITGHSTPTSLAFKPTNLGVWPAAQTNYRVMPGIVWPKNNLYMGQYEQNTDGAGVGIASVFKGIWGAASFGDIDFNNFADDAKVEFHGCATAGDDWNPDQVWNIAAAFSVRLFFAGKKNAVVIGHYNSNSGDENGDFRRGIRNVYYRGALILQTTQKGNITRKEIREAIRKYHADQKN